MATRKSQDSTDARQAAAAFAETVKESAQQIWLAGLGAFAKAQEEGGKAFQTLVEEGASMQRKTQAAAEEKFAEAGSRMEKMASEFSTRATSQWEKLESAFEDRVARTMKKMGVPSSHDIDALRAQMEELNRKLDRLSPRSSPAKAARPTAGAARPSAKAAKGRRTG